MSILPAHEPAGKPPRGALTAGSLCTGYGGLDLAVMAVTGARLAWTAETDKYAAHVLARHWPDVPNLGDVTALDWATVPPVDLVSAGWPCQDISYACPGAGITEGTRSGLWLKIADGLRHLQPAYIFLENVAALRTRGLGKSSVTWPRSGMTRSGSAFALPTPEPRTAATACSSSRSGPGRPPGSRLLPTPVAGNFNDGADLPTWQARRDRQKKLGRNGNGIGTPLPVAIALLPTPMAGDFGADRSAGPVRPSGAKRQTGLPDVIIHRLTGHDAHAGPAKRRRGPAAADPGHRLLAERARPAGRPARQRAPERPGPRRRGHRPHAGPGGRGPAAWAEYEPAIRRWETRPRVPRAAARRAGAVGPAPAVGPVRRVDDGHFSRVKCPTSEFSQVRTCLSVVSCARHVSETDLGRYPHSCAGGARPAQLVPGPDTCRSASATNSALASV